MIPAVSALLLALAATATTAETKLPHLILLALDDIGWADVSYHGSDFTTPHIDALASSGVKLDRMYAMPQCSPTRSALMTGRFAHKIGMQHYTTITPGSLAGLPKETPTMPEMLAETHEAHMIGKWHLGYSSRSQTPTGRGFASYLGYLQGQTDYYNRTIPACQQHQGSKKPGVCLFIGDKAATSPYGPGAAGYDFWDNTTSVPDGFGKYTVDAYMDRAASILGRWGPNSTAKPAKPLFLYFAEQQLHIPLELPPNPAYAEACARAGTKGGSSQVNRTVLCAMASRLDESVGRLVDLLKANQMWDNSLIWAVSDNGGMTHWADVFPASASSNWPLRGGKTTTYEGGVRSVSFVAGGSTLLPPTARGRTISDLMHVTDIFPTFAALAGLQDGAPAFGATGAYAGAAIDGRDAWPYITGTAPRGSVLREELPLQVAVNPITGGLPIVPKGAPRDGKLNYTAMIQWPYKILVGVPYVGAKIIPGQMSTTARDGYWTIRNYSRLPPPADVDAAGTRPRLYNIEDDPRELHDLATDPAQAQRVANMTNRLATYWAAEAGGYVKPQSNFPHPLSNPRFHKWTWAPFRP